MGDTMIGRPDRRRTALRWLRRHWLVVGCGLWALVAVLVMQFSSSMSTTATSAAGRPVGIADRPFESGVRLLAAPTGQLIGVVTTDGVYVLDASGRRLWRRTLDRSTLIAWSPDGTQLATAEAENGITIRRANDGTPLERLPGTGRQLVGLTWNTSTATLVAIDTAGEVWRWQPGSKGELVFGRPFNVWTPTAALDGRGQLAAAIGADGIVRVWHIGETTLAQTMVPRDQATWLAFNPDGAMLAMVGDSSVHLWRVADGQPIGSFTGSVGTITSIAFDPRGNYLAVGTRRPANQQWASDDEAPVVVWRLADGQRIATFAGHRVGVADVTFAPDGQTIFTAGEDGTFRTWSMP